MTRPGNLALWLALVMPCLAVQAQTLDYALKPEQITENVYVFTGHTEHFTRDNGGNIVNTGFIVAPEGVIVIDTGPSLRYGRAQREAIHKTTGRDVVLAIITHAHPDHFLGNQAYEDVPVLALPETVSAIERDGSKLAENLYRLLGGWMEGTIATSPQPLKETGKVELAGRALRLIPLHGHTGADLAVLDETSGVLFAGDLIFHDRTPTTPHADLVRWHEALTQLRKQPFQILVPGHGAATRDTLPFEQTGNYLHWLDETLQSAAKNGLDINETMALPAPERFATLPVFADEFTRSVVHLYPAIEARHLPPTQSTPE